MKINEKLHALRSEVERDLRFAQKNKRQLKASVLWKNAFEEIENGIKNNEYEF